MALERFDLVQVPATPWKNGGGATREIACWPPGADMDHFDWRVSVATVAQSGPFSCFAGVDRVITLLTGDGMQLRRSRSQAQSHSHSQSPSQIETPPPVDHVLQPLTPFAFAGDDGMDCDVLRGACTDFNLMTRRGRWQGRVRVIRGAALLPGRPAGALLAVQGRWTVAPLAEAESPTVSAAVAVDSAMVLAPDTGLWWADESCGFTAAPVSADEGSAVLLHVVLARA